MVWLFCTVITSELRQFFYSLPMQTGRKAEIRYVQNVLIWLVRGHAWPLRPIFRPNNHHTSFTVPHYRHWILVSGMTALTFQSGSKKSQMNAGESVSMALSPVVSAPGELTLQSIYRTAGLKIGSFSLFILGISTQ